MNGILKNVYIALLIVNNENNIFSNKYNKEI